MIIYSDYLYYHGDRFTDHMIIYSESNDIDLSIYISVWICRWIPRITDLGDRISPQPVLERFGTSGLDGCCRFNLTVMACQPPPRVIWVNYNDLTNTTKSHRWWLVRGILPKWPEFRLVNYSNLPRVIVTLWCSTLNTHNDQVPDYFKLHGAYHHLNFSCHYHTLLKCHI